MVKNMLDTSARLLRLLSLLQTRKDWSGADLAERLGITTRTVRRDIDRLRELGYPVDASVGVGGGYQLGAGAEMPPLLLDDAEVLALAPHGVLPEHQGEGAGTALVNALLQKAQADGEEVVVVYGWPEYYAKFGFHRASEHGVHAAFARQPEALQVLTLQDGAEVPAGEFRYPPAFGAENAQVAGR